MAWAVTKHERILERKYKALMHIWLYCSQNWVIHAGAVTARALLRYVFIHLVQLVSIFALRILTSKATGSFVFQRNHASTFLASLCREIDVYLCLGGDLDGVFFASHGQVYEQVASAFKKEKDVVIAKVDADAHKDLGERYVWSPQTSWIFVEPTFLIIRDIWQYEVPAQL